MVILPKLLALRDAPLYQSCTVLNMQSVVRSLLLWLLGGCKIAHQMYGSAEGVRKFGNPNMWEFFPFKDQRHNKMMRWTNMRWKVGQICDEKWDKYKTEPWSIDWSSVALSTEGRSQNTKLRLTPTVRTTFSPAFQFPPHLVSSRCNQNPLEAAGCKTDFHGKC